MGKLAAAVIRLRIPIIIVTVLLTAVFGYFVKDIHINPDIIGYLPKDDPVTKLNTYISEKYGGSQMAIVAIEDDDVFSADTIGAIQHLTSEFQRLEGVRYVTSLTNLIDIKKVDDWLEIGKLIDAGNLPADQAELRELREYTLGKDMYRGRLVSADGRATVIVCRLREDADEPYVAGEIEKIVEQANLKQKVYYAGMPFQLTEIGSLVARDMIKLAPLAALLILGSLFIGLRSLRGMLLPVLAAAIGGVWVVGIMSLCRVSFSVISNIIPVVLIAVGSAYSIHVISSFAETARAGGDRRRQSREALRKVALPVILAAVTTIAGFTAFIFGSYLGMIKEFGIFSALGVFFSLVLSLTFVPSLLSLLPPARRVGLKSRKASAAGRRRRDRRSAAAEAAEKQGLFARAGGFVVRRRRAIVAAAAGLVALSIIGMPLIHREVDILTYFRKGTRIRISEQMMKERFGGSTTLQILVRGNIQDPEVLRKMKAMEELLRSRPELHNVYSVVELIEEMNYAMIDRRSIPDSEAKVANLWFLLEGEETLNQLVSEDKDEAVIQATLESMNTRVMSELIQVIRARIDQLETPDISMQLGGSLLMYNELDRAITRSQIQSLLIATALIFLFNLILLRSVAGSLLGLIPVVFTLFILFGTMGLAGIPLDVVTVLLGSISIGVGVDYSIHFLNRFREEYRLSERRDLALKNTLGTTGKAIAINMITVSLGFSSLLLGSLNPLRRFTLLIAVSMIGSGAGALALLPAIMMMSPAGVFRALVEKARLFGAGLKILRQLKPVSVDRGKKPNHPHPKQGGN
jgi:predicted RND superfamily exporter protein